MLVFRQLRALAEFRRRHLPYLKTVEDRDLTREIGLHQVLGAPLTLKQLLLADVGSAATVQRRLQRLKDLGVIRQRRSATDRRVLELTLSSGCMRAYGKYGMLLGKGQAAPLGTEGASDAEVHHVCALCDGAASRLEVAMRFLKAGLRQRHHCVVLAPPGMRDLISSEFKRGAGMRPSAGQLAFHGGEKTPQAMLAFVSEMLREARAAGKTVHLLGDMTWTQHQRVSFDAVMDFEARLDPLARRFRAQVLCLYDAGRFSSPQLLRALKCHRDTKRYPLVLG